MTQIKVRQTRHMSKCLEAKFYLWTLHRQQRKGNPYCSIFLIDGHEGIIIDEYQSKTGLWLICILVDNSERVLAVTEAQFNNCWETYKHTWKAE